MSLRCFVPTQTKSAAGIVATNFLLCSFRFRLKPRADLNLRSAELFITNAWPGPVLDHAAYCMRPETSEQSAWCPYTCSPTAMNFSVNVKAGGLNKLFKWVRNTYYRGRLEIYFFYFCKGLGQSKTSAGALCISVIWIHDNTGTLMWLRVCTRPRTCPFSAA